MAERFVLDTCFVVGSEPSTEFRIGSATQVLKRTVPESFVHATLKPLDALSASTTNNPGCAPGSDLGEDSPNDACIDAGATYRLYRGATIHDPVEGMFSFAPCLSTEEKTAAFPRPNVTSEAIEQRLTQGFRNRYERQVAAIAADWASIAGQVIQAGLALGVEFSEPQLPQNDR